jgi:hypothetical protein
MSIPADCLSTLVDVAFSVASHRPLWEERVAIHPQAKHALGW